VIRPLKCLLVSVAALLSACASFSGVQPGQSSRDEVLRLLGKPSSRRIPARENQSRRDSGSPRRRAGGAQ
jgi:hypothetical protein